MLEVRDIHTYYGKSHILQGVDMNLKEGEIVCLLGRNGVGKSTTLKSIMGLVKPRQGSIRFRDEEITGLEPFEIARRGVGYVPEDRRIFRSLTVHENLLMGIKETKGHGGRNGWTVEAIYEKFPRLRERKDSKGGHLSGGEQQMLTIARTLTGNPSLILVDEPTEGLAPLIVRDVIDMLAEVRQGGVTVLMVEQNFKAAIKIADRFYIMGKGHIVFEGDTQALLAAEDVRKNYLEV
ncbi:MAG TPA: ABC transporter ATP-binding protein [Syntrophales bacterium]|nr:ABC transporter ATP-binding protein [Syntrophales bacterium]HOM06347.1 ABC transporter ATP-binding protein [Syntrophales bacterium]HON99202.1 ABC transporter ATP-binding protein [Syntrophales bacterium]HPC00310.1 ABC transporter ATP-binding protein [Syntrophales bacterium]HPQ05973.1 ABC transporter ATP-binding protein [Syntrophales bacterium]